MSESKSTVEKAAKTKRKGLPNWLKTCLAILVSLLFIVFYFKNINWEEFFKVIDNANLLLAFIAVFIPQIVVWLFSVYQTERTFFWFHKPFDWKNYLWVKGALYLVTMVNTGAGNIGTALYLQQKTHVSWLKFTAINLFRIALSLASIGLLLILLTIGLHVFGIFEKTPLNPWIWWSLLIGGQLLLLDGWLYFIKGKAVGVSKFLFTSGREENGTLIGGIRNRDHELWVVFRQATLAQWLIFMLWAQIPLLILAFSYWLMVLAFNIEIPWLLFFATIFLVIALQDMPIAFAGFGATTFAWELFYGDFASTEAIAGITLCIPILRLITRAFIGIISIKPALSDISYIIDENKQGRGVSIFSLRSKNTESEAAAITKV